jgi:hypothetical protein
MFACAVSADSPFVPVVFAHILFCSCCNAAVDGTACGWTSTVAASSFKIMLLSPRPGHDSSAWHAALAFRPPTKSPRPKLWLHPSLRFGLPWRLATVQVEGVACGAVSAPVATAGACTTQNLWSDGNGQGGIRGRPRFMVPAAATATAAAATIAAAVAAAFAPAANAWPPPWSRWSCSGLTLGPISGLALGSASGSSMGPAGAALASGKHWCLEESLPFGNDVQRRSSLPECANTHFAPRPRPPVEPALICLIGAPNNGQQVLA